MVFPMSLTPTPAGSPIIGGQEVFYLAALALITVLISLFLVFYFSRRITLQTHLRNTLVDAAVSLQAEKGLRELEDKAYSGPLSAGNPFPSEADAINLKWDLWLQSQRAKADALYLREPDPRTYEEYIAEAGIQEKDIPEKYLRQPKSAKRSIMINKNWASKRIKNGKERKSKYMLE
jgi:hypothetical protein